MLVNLITLLSHDAFAFLRDARLERAIGSQILCPLSCSDSLLLPLSDLISTQVEWCVAILFSRRWPIDLRLESVCAHLICFEKLFGFLPQGAPLVCLVVQAVFQLLEVTAACPSGIKLRLPVDRRLESTFFQFPELLISSSLLLLYGSLMMAHGPLFELSIKRTPVSNWCLAHGAAAPGGGCRMLPPRCGIRGGLICSCWAGSGTCTATTRSRGTASCTRVVPNSLSSGRGRRLLAPSGRHRSCTAPMARSWSRLWSALSSRSRTTWCRWGPQRATTAPL
mmetsp:Transcript_136621/g.237518  ORF Transcript_136621/g.237518 Transcript_136621/m.237518 type:complete len:280 (+) Transcript_136621:1104-1943(+)